MNGGQGQKLLYTIEECTELSSLSRAQLYRLIYRQELPTVTVGRSRRVTATQLEAYVRRLEQASGSTRYSR